MISRDVTTPTTTSGGVLAAVFPVSSSGPELYPEALFSRATHVTNS